MAVQVLGQENPLAQATGRLTGSVIGSYYGTKARKERKEEEKTKKKKAEREESISSALQTLEGFDEAKANAWSKLDEKTLGTLLENVRLEKLSGAKETVRRDERTNASAFFQSIGMSKNEADVASRAPKNIQQQILKEMEAKDAPFKIGQAETPNVQQIRQQEQQYQQGLRQPGQRTIGEMISQAATGQPAQQQQFQQPMQPQEGQAMPTQGQQQAMQQATALQGTESPMPQSFGFSSPKDTQDLRAIIQDGIKAKETTKKESRKLLEMLGFDEQSQDVIVGNKLNKTIASYFLKLADGDPDRARDIAKSFGYRSK